MVGLFGSSQPGLERDWAIDRLLSAASHRLADLAALNLEAWLLPARRVPLTRQQTKQPRLGIAAFR